MANRAENLFEKTNMSVPIPSHKQVKNESLTSFLRSHLRAVFIAVALPIAMGLALAVTAAITMRGSFGHAMVIMMLFYASVGVGLLMVGMLCFALDQRGRRSLLVGCALLGLLGGIALQVPSYITGRLLLRRDIHEAKAYCETLVPRLDAYRQRHGRYPATLKAILRQPDEPPRLLDDEFYEINDDGESFGFVFWSPGEMMEGFYYVNSSRSWTRID